MDANGYALELNPGAEARLSELVPLPDPDAMEDPGVQTVFINAMNAARARLESEGLAKRVRVSETPAPIIQSVTVNHLNRTDRLLAAAGKTMIAHQKWWESYPLARVFNKTLQDTGAPLKGKNDAPPDQPDDQWQAMLSFRDSEGAPLPYVTDILKGREKKRRQRARKNK